MKKELSVFCIFLMSFFTGINAYGQANLKGYPTISNFIGSPAMWVISIGIIILIVFVIFIRKKTKMIPEPILKSAD